jgi:hypothetical protein
VFAMSDDQAFEAFREVRWGGDGEPECPACGVVAGHLRAERAEGQVLTCAF